MSIRDNLDISAYLVLGPENTLGRPVGDVVAQAPRWQVPARSSR